VDLEGVAKEQLLAFIARSVLGQQMGIIAAVAISLACFTTSVALSIVYCDFLKREFFKGHNTLPILLTLLSSYVMSIFGLEGITFVTAPALQVCYPALLILILWNLGKKQFASTTPFVQK
jgi:LIVCS family branched-chain amino acid:cation transporter